MKKSDNRNLKFSLTIIALYFLLNPRIFYLLIYLFKFAFNANKTSSYEYLYPLYTIQS